MILAKCLRTLGARAEAEDVAQDTFTRVGDAIDGFTVTALVADNGINLLYQLRARREVAITADVREATSLEAQVSARRLIEQLTASLTPRTLEVLVLHRIDRLSQPEIGEVLGVSERTVRRILGEADGHLSALGTELAS